MNYNEVEQQRLTDQAAARKRFDAENTARQLAERKAMLERTAANYQQAKAQAERERTQAEQVAHEQALREALKESYVAANGSEFGFNEAYPKLREDFVRQQTLAHVELDPVTSRDIAQKALDLRYQRG